MAPSRLEVAQCALSPQQCTISVNNEINTRLSFSDRLFSLLLQELDCSHHVGCKGRSNPHFLCPLSSTAGSGSRHTYLLRRWMDEADLCGMECVSSEDLLGHDLGAFRLR